MNKKLIFFSFIIFLGFITSTYARIGDYKTPPDRKGGSFSNETFLISLKFKESNSEILSIGSDDTGQATLVWKVTYTNGEKPTQGEAICTASGGWTGEKPMQGEEKIPLPTENTDYILNCYKKDKAEEGGIATASIRIKSISLVANPSIIVLGENVKLSYDISSIYEEKTPPSLTTTTLNPRWKLPGAIQDVIDPLLGGTLSPEKIKPVTPECYLNDELIHISDKEEITEYPVD
ncbi:MAG: hypothetical protein ACP5OX_02045, partial [Minisyncoccia bacterium]